jgi:hypothetical protein
MNEWREIYVSVKGGNITLADAAAALQCVKLQYDEGFEEDVAGPFPVRGKMILVRNISDSGKLKVEMEVCKEAEKPKGD